MRKLDSTFLVPFALHVSDRHARIKDTLRKSFADLANDFERRLYGISSELAAVEGPLDVRTFDRIFRGVS